MKSTSGMDPRLNVFGSTLIVLPEYKGAVYGSGQLKRDQRHVGIPPRSWIPRSTTTTCSTTSWPRSGQPRRCRRRRDARRARVLGRDQRHEFVLGARWGVVHALRPRLLARHHPSHSGPRPTWDRRPRRRLQLDRAVQRRQAFTTGTMGGLAHIVDGRTGDWDRTRHTSGPVTQALQDAYALHIPFTPLPQS